MSNRTKSQSNDDWYVHHGGYGKPDIRPEDLPAPVLNIPPGQGLAQPSIHVTVVVPGQQSDQRAVNEAARVSNTMPLPWQASGRGMAFIFFWIAAVAAAIAFAGWKLGWWL